MVIVRFWSFLFIETRDYNTRYNISFSACKNVFIYLMSLNDFTNDQNICVELFETTFTHYALLLHVKLYL